MSRLFLILILSTFCAAQAVKLEGETEPRFINAKVEAVATQAGLRGAFDKAVSTGGARWIGYSVPTTARSRFICCFDNWDQWKQRGCCSGCRLEREGGSFFNSNDGACVSSTPPTSVIVLFRAEAGSIKKIRAFTPDCGLDAGDKPVTWLTSASSKDSLDLLDGFLKQWQEDSERSSRKVAEGALQAIALHADAGADRILERLLSSNSPRKLRQEAAFWTANERGRPGFEMLKRIVPQDPDYRFREEATFAISQSSEKHDANALLVQMARIDAEPRVRGQALFWLAQQAAREAGKAISDAVENDPESHVREKAIFALSQMPKDEGVPLLIKYAKTHKDPRVRKQAIFWLGESRDPRALDFLEQVVLGKQ